MENFIIDGNKIKEPGLLGMTKYYIVNNEIRDGIIFGKTVYVISGNEIKEPGVSGKTVFVINGNKIQRPKESQTFLGQVIGIVKDTYRKKEEKEKQQIKVIPQTQSEFNKTPKTSPIVSQKTAEEIKRERMERFEEARREEVERQKKKYLIGAFVLGFFIIFFIGMLAFEYSNIWYFKELHSIRPNDAFMREASAATTRVVFLWIFIIAQVVGEILLIRKRSNLT